MGVAWVCYALLHPGVTQLRHLRLDTFEAFVDFAHQRASVEVLYFNDPEVTGVEPSRGHDDHLHLCFSPGIDLSHE